MVKRAVVVKIGGVAIRRKERRIINMYAHGQSSRGKEGKLTRNGVVREPSGKRRFRLSATLRGR